LCKRDASQLIKEGGLSLILRRTVDKLSEMQLYFRRGYGVYISLPMSVLNFTLISYNLLVKNLKWTPEWLNFTTYFITVGILGLVITTVIGFLDYTRGMYQQEQRVIVKHSLSQQQILRKLDEIEAKIDRKRR